MNILAFDTSSKACTVSLMNNSMMYSDIRIDKNTHSENLISMVDLVLKKANLLIRDIDYIACVTGPGSFTGLRIGVSTAKGLAHAYNCKCISLNSLDALALNCKDHNTAICTSYDARSNQVYSAAFIKNKSQIINKIDYRACYIEEFIDNINNLGMRSVFFGEGCYTYKNIIKEKIKVPYEIHDILYPTPSNLIDLSILKLNQFTDYKSISPLYLREPQAIRMLKQGKLNINA